MNFNEINRLSLNELVSIQKHISNRITVLEIEDANVLINLIGGKIFRSHDRKAEFFRILLVKEEELLGVTARYDDRIESWSTSTGANPFEVSIFTAHINWWEAKARLGSLQEKVNATDNNSVRTLFNFIRAVKWV